MTKKHFLKVESNFGNGRGDEAAWAEAKGPAGGMCRPSTGNCSRDKIRQNDYCLLKYV